MKFLHTTWAKVLVAIWIALLTMQVCIAQTDFISPYSLYGPGIALPRNSAMQAGMGGSGAALFDLYRVNLINPAVAANYAEPIFDIGGKGSISEYSTGTESFNASNFRINNISLAMPIKRNIWSITAGIMPSTALGYNAVTRVNEPDLNLDYLTEYTGSGGVAQASLGTGFKVVDRLDSLANVTVLAFGAQANYNFGTIESGRRLYFPEDRTLLGFRTRESILLRDFSGEVGMHFHTNLIKKRRGRSRMLKMLVGASYGTGTLFNRNAELTQLAYNFRLTAGLNEQLRDTIFYSARERGTMSLPTSYTIGIAFDYFNDKKSRYRLAFDYRSRQWSEYSVSFSDNLVNYRFNNSEGISTGLEFTPNVTSLNVFERLEYRVGYRRESTNLNIRNTPITEYGISFGISLPIHYKRGTTFSTLNLATEFGSNGTTENELIRENFVRIYAGFSLTPHFRNRWFVKPKYD